MSDLLVSGPAYACMFLFACGWCLLAGFVIGGMFVRRKADKELDLAYAKIPRAFAEGRKQGLREVERDAR